MILSILSFVICILSFGIISFDIILPFLLMISFIPMLYGFYLLIKRENKLKGFLLILITLIIFLDFYLLMMLRYPEPFYFITSYLEKLTK